MASLYVLEKIDLCVILVPTTPQEVLTWLRSSPWGPTLVLSVLYHLPLETFFGIQFYIGNRPLFFLPQKVYLTWRGIL